MQRDPLDAILKSPFQKEQRRPGARGTIAPRGTQLHIEKVRHGALVRWPTARDKEQWTRFAQLPAGLSTSRFHRAAPGAAQSLPTYTVSALSAGDKSNSSAIQDA